MHALIQDLRYGIRNLLTRPGFSLIAIITLAIGIGANTAVFSIANGILFRPRPVAQPEQLVELYTGTRENPYHNSAYQDYLVFRDQAEIFSGLAVYHIGQFKLGGAEEVEQIWGETVSGNYFDVLGVKAANGRMFLAEEDQTPGTHPVTVISHNLWKRRFAADPAIVGRTITVNNQPLTVIGVAPPEYSGMIRGLGIDIWVPTMMVAQLMPERGAQMLTSRGNSWLFMVGRLRPDVTLENARARVELVSQQLKQQFPDSWFDTERGRNQTTEEFVTVLPESETRIHPQAHSSVYAAIGLVLAMINLVLLIACMNLAGLLLSRALERRREIAVRLALGARRSRIIRQLLTESVLLALVAGAAGALLGMWLTNLLVTFMPPLPEGVRLSLDLRMDLRVLAYTFGFSFVVGVFFGLLPALQASRANVVETLNRSSAAFTGAYSRSRLRNGLIVAQVAFAIVLLVGAGLAIRSLQNIAPTRLGFDSTNLIVAPLGFSEQYDLTRKQTFYRELAERTRALPGVEEVSFISTVPGGLLGRSLQSIGIEGYQPAPGEKMEVDYNTISAGYLTTMKIPIVQGRDFSEHDRDGAPCVAVVNEAFQRRYFVDNRALGKRLNKFPSQPQKQICEIVGVVHDNKVQSLQKEPLPWFAFPLQQSDPSRMMMLVHSLGSPESVVPHVRSLIRSLEPDMPTSDVLTLNDTFKPFLFAYRVFGIVIGACGGLAVLLACLGVYGTVAYAVGQRTREIGIRIALGANKQHVLNLVIRQGLHWVIYGLVGGLVLAVVATRVLASSMFDVDLLYGVGTTDVLTYVLVTVLIVLSTLLACYLPARRATKVDPLEALRYE